MMVQRVSPGPFATWRLLSELERPAVRGLASHAQPELFGTSAPQDRYDGSKERNPASALEGAGENGVPSGMDLLGLVMALLSRAQHGDAQRSGQTGGPAGGGGCAACKGSLGTQGFDQTRSLGSNGWSPNAARGPYGPGNPEGVTPLQGSSAESRHGLSERAVNMILKHEGNDQPGKWPGGQSGITLPGGYDLGHKTRAEFRRDWGGKLPASTMRRLESAIGVKGGAARAMAGRFSDIKIPYAQGRDVFMQSTLPKFVDMTRKAFPGYDRLNADQKGALVSLVFNRGPGMQGPRRQEMRALRAAVARGDVRDMARQIRAMKRLWAGRGLNGLLVRRNTEAQLISAVA